MGSNPVVSTTVTVHDASTGGGGGGGAGIPAGSGGSVTGSVENQGSAGSSGQDGTATTGGAGGAGGNNAGSGGHGGDPLTAPGAGGSGVVALNGHAVATSYAVGSNITIIGNIPVGYVSYGVISNTLG